jgi:hypothetical protein
VGSVRAQVYDRDDRWRTGATASQSIHILICKHLPKARRFTPAGLFWADQIGIVPDEVGAAHKRAMKPPFSAELFD